MIRTPIFLIMLTLTSYYIQCQSSFDEQVVFFEFEKFIKTFNKTYTNMNEFKAKYGVFKTNYFFKKSLVSEHNETNIEEDDDDKEDTTRLSEFMDLTPEEFASGYLKLTNTTSPENATNYFSQEELDQPLKDEEVDESEIPNDEIFTNSTDSSNMRFLQSRGIPRSWDWRKRGAVNSIRTQGTCGGCWAFAAVCNIEGLYFRKYGKLPKFSEQQLIDCSPYDSGCAGGIMHTAYTYIFQYGLAMRRSYPYQFSQGYCRYNPYYGKSLVKNYQFAGTTNEEYIKRMLYKVGPLAITINARLLQYYTGGVINIPYSRCPYAPDHGVNIVGYGTTRRGLKYWVIRNTWGPYWGEGGYFRIARGRGLCGINQYVITAVLK